jgi:membrane fusion protein (multidrug efflux system)
MNTQSPSTLARWIASMLMIAVVLGGGAALALWKHNANLTAAEASANQPEPVEVVAVATAERREHRDSTTAIGTVLATRSIVVKNELSGTVRRVSLEPGQVVEPGTVLVALDVSVEEADLQALEAQASLAETTLARVARLEERGAAAREAVDQARAQRDMTQAQMARVRAIIAKKTIRAPFRARVGLSDVHPGQYLDQGMTLTTLQGVSDAVHVDFAVAQGVARGIPVGSEVQVLTGEDDPPIQARVVAIDARVDATTRNATIRAKLRAGGHSAAPGASVRVNVPLGTPSARVAIPVSALRKGPTGDHVWVVAQDAAGATRVKERSIQSGPVSGDRVIVLSGLTEGERVAATGSFKLREGMKVQPAAALAAASATRD